MYIHGKLLDPMTEHRTQFAFKGNREHMLKVNVPNMVYPGQHIDIEIPKGSTYHVIVPDTLEITFDLDIESTDKARTVVNNVGRALVKKKLFMLGSTEIETINNSDVYDMYKDLYLTEKEREEKRLQDIQPANGLKVRVGAKKADGIALTLTTQENANKNTFDKRFSIPLNFDFFSYPVYPYGLEKQRLIVTIELNSLEKVILCAGGTSATYKLSYISLEYNAIFDEPYATTIGQIYIRKSIPYTKVTSIYYETLNKKDTNWKIDVNNLSVRSLQRLLLLFLDKRDDLRTKMKNFIIQALRKF